MAERPIFELRRGIEATLVIAAGVGEDPSALSCVAIVQRLPGGRNSTTPNPEIAATYQIDPFLGDTLRGPGWHLSLSAAVVDALPVGVFQSTVTISEGGEPRAVREWLLSII